MEPDPPTKPEEIPKKRRKSKLEQLDRGYTRETRTRKKQEDQSYIAPKEKSKGKTDQDKKEEEKEKDREHSSDFPPRTKSLAKKTKAK